MKKILLVLSVATLLLFGVAYTEKPTHSRTVLDPDDTIYRVVVNSENQYSIWPADRENPLGWEDAGKQGTKEECVAHMKELWDKMRPEKPASGGDETRVTERKGNPDIKVDVTATKTHLLKGETAVVTVTVSGLKPTQRNRWLWLEKTGVVSMEGGDAQSLRIGPNDVRSDGTYQIKRTVTGKQVGGFNITATVMWKPWEIKLAEKGPKNRRQVKKEGDSLFFVIENAENPLTGDPLEGEYVVEYQCIPGTLMKGLFPVLVKKGKGKVEIGQTSESTPTSESNIHCFYIQDGYKFNKYITSIEGLRWDSEATPGLAPLGGASADMLPKNAGSYRVIELKENAGENGFRLKKKGKAWSAELENVKDPKKGDPLEGEWVVEYRCVPGTLIQTQVLVFKKGKADLLFPPVCFGQTEFATPPSLSSARQIQLGLRFEF